MIVAANFGCRGPVLSPPAELVTLAIARGATLPNLSSRTSSQGPGGWGRAPFAWHRVRRLRQAIPRSPNRWGA